MPCEVNDGCCDVFGGGEALAKLGGLGDGIEKLVGDDLTGVHVARVVFHQRRIECPVFVDLRGEFHPVTRNVGAGEGGVADVGKQAMQSVAELVEDGV